MSKSTIIPYFRAQVLAGDLVFTNKKFIGAYLKPLESKMVHVTIRTEKKPRSNDQNRYYWGVVVALIADFTGMTVDETHEALKNKFLKAKKAVKRGDKLIWEVDTVRSTAVLSTSEFMDYVGDVRQFAMKDLGLDIPLPDEVDLTNY